MLILLSALLSTLGSMFRSRAVLELENIALRHQIGVLRRSARNAEADCADRCFGFSLRVWGDWRSALDIVNPRPRSPGIARDFAFWTWKIRHGHVGRPAVPLDVRNLIRKMSRGNRRGCAKNSRRTAQTRH